MTTDKIMIQAVNNRLVVQPLKPKEKVKGALIMPDSDINEAIVIAKGSEVCPNVEIDDIVILMYRSGIEFDLDGEKFLSIVQEEILCAYNRMEFDCEE